MTIMLISWRRRVAALRTRTRTQEPRQQLSIADETGRSMVTLMFSPQVVEHGNRASTYADGERDGRAPLLLRSGDPRPTLSFETLLAAQDIDVSVEGHITALETIASRNQRVRLLYGPQESRGLWRLTDLSWSSQARNAGGRVTRAMVSLSFTRAVDVSAKRGPLTGGKAPAPRPPAKKPPTPRIHVVQRGETLAAISNRYYRTPTRWRQIADRNRIRDPKKLQIGTRLVIP